MKVRIANTAEWLCSHTGERLWFVFHPIIEWGWGDHA